MKEYLDIENNCTYILSHYKRNKSWLEIPKGTEVITGSKLNRYSLVFWKPSVGEVWGHDRFAKYEMQDSVSYEEYIDRWVSNPIVWLRG